ARRAAVQGCSQVKVLPLFLSPGVHVQEDLPTELAIAHQILGASIELDLMPHLGHTQEHWQRFFQRLFSRWDPSAAKVLLAHGSRRPGGNQPTFNLATTLNAYPAFWATEPRLTQQLETLAQTGISQVVIAPYFLFPGRITRAIVSEVEQLQARFASMQLTLSQPLNNHPHLLDLIIWQLKPESFAIAAN
ncbi:MAG: sirohydrochlorin chelatase, partial [Cyanobacteria bacterium P01_H01_bin.15]